MGSGGRGAGEGPAADPTAASLAQNGLQALLRTLNREVLVHTDLRGLDLNHSWEARKGIKMLSCDPQ